MEQELGRQSPRIILASASPRRHELLSLMGLVFETAAPDINEEALAEPYPWDLARRLSLAKAQAVSRCHPHALIIAADTLVVLDRQVLGKPADAAMAYDMLVRLRNRRHLVYSGFCFADHTQHRHHEQVAVTPVLMRDYSDMEIERYVASGDPMDKAGAYAIQFAGFNPVARFDGCYANVMGLPMCHLYGALTNWGIDVPVHPLKCCPLAVQSGCCWSRDILESTGDPLHSGELPQ